MEYFIAHALSSMKEGSNTYICDVQFLLRKIKELVDENAILSERELKQRTKTRIKSEDGQGLPRDPCRTWIYQILQTPEWRKAINGNRSES